MVRKLICVAAACMILYSAATMSAGAASPYEGTISSTYIDIFSQIDISANDDYVFFRSGQNSYSMLVGDINHSGTSFSLIEPGKLYVLDIVNTSGTGYGGSTYHKLTVSDVTSYTLNTGSMLVYSNLGNNPILGERGDIYAYTTAFLLSVIFLCSVIGAVFGFVLRPRGTSTRGNDIQRNGR